MDRESAIFGVDYWGGEMSKSFDEIVYMISHACNKHFYTGDKDIKETIVKCATEIYIAQMTETGKEK